LNFINGGQVQIKPGKPFVCFLQKAVWNLINLLRMFQSFEHSRWRFSRRFLKQMRRLLQKTTFSPNLARDFPSLSLPPPRSPCGFWKSRWNSIEIERVLFADSFIHRHRPKRPYKLSSTSLIFFAIGITLLTHSWWITIGIITLSLSLPLSLSLSLLARFVMLAALRAEKSCASWDIVRV